MKAEGGHIARGILGSEQWSLKRGIKADRSRLGTRQCLRIRSSRTGKGQTKSRVGRLRNVSPKALQSSGPG